MRTIAMIAGLAVAAATLAPSAADAACQRRVNGTLIGAATGGLLGHVVAGRGDHTEGTLLGAAAGGLIGNQVSKCRRSYSRAYSPARTARASSYTPARYAANSCRYETRPFYDGSGRVVYAQTRVCGAN